MVVDHMKSGRIRGIVVNESDHSTVALHYANCCHPFKHFIMKRDIGIGAWFSKKIVGFYKNA